MKHDLWTVRDFCWFNGISSTTFYREVKDGRLKVIKFGHRTLVTQATKERWLKLCDQPRKRKCRRAPVSTKAAVQKKQPLSGLFLNLFSLKRK